VAGHTVVSTAKCAAADKTQVARQKTATLEVGTAPKRREITE
jgi:hypothetical protein